jgi:hypothetical protein
MPRILYGNFEFEHELESTAYRPPARIAAMSAQLAPHLIALAEDGDFAWSPVEMPRSFLNAAARIGLPNVKCVGPFGEVGAVSSEKLDLLPWGFSEAAARFALSRDWTANCPDVQSVRKVNDREFAFDLEAALDCGLPRSARVRSHDEFLTAVRLASARLDLPETELRWVAKCRFGMASRGRILGTGLQLDDAAAGWLWKQFAKNGSVLFEPWCECDREFSTQWVIPPEPGPPVLRGWTEIQTERAGTPSGWLRPAGVPFSDSEFRSALPALNAAVEGVASAGYFGPVGIDSMRLRLPGSTNSAPMLRPLQDINARHTLGRVALELADRLALDSDAAWLQVPSKKLCRILEVGSAQDALKLYSECGLDISSSLLKGRLFADSPTLLPGDAQAWLTSPLWTGDVPASRCGVLIASRERSKLKEFFRGIQ